jgi:hypothetical protein
MDVFGLSTSAKGPSRRMLDHLEDRRVFVVYDGDDAGRAAVHEWMRARPHESFVVRLPEETDILSCGLPIGDLLVRARRKRTDSASEPGSPGDRIRGRSAAADTRTRQAYPTVS